MITPADLEQMLAFIETAGDVDTSAQAGLETPEQVYGFIAYQPRMDGGDEADLCELLARTTGLSPDEARRIARALKPLGFTLVADRLREIAGRRKHDLRPLR